MTTPVRHLAQPGPALLPRVEWIPGQAHPLAFTLEPGLTLLEAVSRPLRAAGFASAAVVLEGGGGFAPFAYVLPAHAPDTTHVAWYSETHAPPGGARLERATATLGLRDGQPLLHCHAVWVEEGDGARRAGHVLPERSVVAAPIAARAWGLSGMAFLAEPDAETNFTLFHPVAAGEPAAPSRPGTAGRAAALRIRPNEDLAEALEAACRRHGFAHGAALRGGVGSLVGARFAEGGVVEDIATELLVTGGGIAPDATGELRAEVSVALADMRGRVHEGRLLRGRNPVCITFELLLEELPPA
jgi:predicted DNA-binding protein with PD1-like motif